VSVGVATFPQDAAAQGRLIEAADKALYSAKTAGKNAVVVAGWSARRSPRPIAPFGETWHPDCLIFVNASLRPMSVGARMRHAMPVAGIVGDGMKQRTWWHESQESTRQAPG
jgi:hypothetical protein